MPVAALIVTLFTPSVSLNNVSICVLPAAHLIFVLIINSPLSLGVSPVVSFDEDEVVVSLDEGEVFVSLDEVELLSLPGLVLEADGKKPTDTKNKTCK